MSQEQDRDEGEQYPSAALLAELQGLVGKKDKKRKSLRAWEILCQAAGNADFGMLADFALDNHLVVSCELDRGVQTVTWTNPIDGSEMVWVPPGPFLVGKDKERAQAAGFSLARYPVTNAQYKRFLDASGYKPSPDHLNPDAYLAHWIFGQPPEDKLDHPVVFVSFIDALNYCRWAGLHLPTEWLWEKAARGPDGREYPWGDNMPWGKNMTKMLHVMAEDTCPVGQYPRVRTPYGCEDMVGNVSEWCQLDSGKNYGAMPTDWPEMTPEEDGSGPYAAVRGSCFLRTVRRRMAAWHRRRLSVYRRNQWTGFRPALLAAWRPGD